MENGKIGLVLKITEKNFDDMPLVSIIMPVYNSEQFLARSIHSVINQTYENIELICIDDGSVDLSLNILNKIKREFPKKRIKVISQKNLGPAAARNKGLDKAKGKYVAFLDSDDFIELDTYAKLVNTAMKTDADIVVFGGLMFPDNVSENQWIVTKLTTPDRVYNTADAGKKALLAEESSKPFIWQHFIKRELIESNPQLRMNENFKLGEDQIFIFSYFPRAKKVVYISDKLYRYRIRGCGSIMTEYKNFPVTKFRCHLDIVKNILIYWKNNDISDINGDMISYFLNFLYEDFRHFSEYLKIKFSKEILNIFESCEYDLMMCNEYAYEIVIEIKEMAKRELPNIIENINAMEVGVNIFENEIMQIMRSKAYKIGRLLTKKRERIDEKWIIASEDKSIF